MRVAEVLTTLAMACASPAPSNRSPAFGVFVIEAPDLDTCGGAQQSCGPIGSCLLADQGQTRAELSRGVGGAIRQELAQVIVLGRTGRLDEL